MRRAPAVRSVTPSEEPKEARDGNELKQDALPPDAELKARHRKMWASGDYPSMVETFLLPLGPRLVEACAIVPACTCSTSAPAPATRRSPPPSAARA
jgi:hypothetical protein